MTYITSMLHTLPEVIGIVIISFIVMHCLGIPAYIIAVKKIRRTNSDSF
ncbi:Uncharacterised protein [Escherichia coli]|nr:Uncharacterised protein [Escherichia coli]VVZ78323.1 Uncharacterised protein [Escherichia coli]VWN06717.1 Uncharacterised protein [Escherichia coli]